MTKTKKRGKNVSEPVRSVAKEHIAILEDEVEMDKLYHDFDINDNEEINDILSGRIGEVAVEW